MANTEHLARCLPAPERDKYAMVVQQASRSVTSLMFSGTLKTVAVGSAESFFLWPQVQPKLEQALSRAIARSAHGGPTRFRDPPLT